RLPRLHRGRDPGAGGKRRREARPRTRRGREMSAAAKAVGAPVSTIEGHPTGFVVDALARMGASGWVQGVLPRSRQAKFTGRARTLRFAPAGEVREPVRKSMYEIMRSLAPGEVLVVATGGADCWFM